MSERVSERVSTQCSECSSAFCVVPVNARRICDLMEVGLLLLRRRRRRRRRIPRFGPQSSVRAKWMSRSDVEVELGHPCGSDFQSYLSVASATFHRHWHVEGCDEQFEGRLHRCCRHSPIASTLGRVCTTRSASALSNLIYTSHLALSLAACLATTRAASVCGRSTRSSYLLHEVSSPRSV